MLLAIDVGNSQTSFGLFSKGRLNHHWRIETRPFRTADEHAAIFFALLGQAGLGDIAWEGAALCSVVPAVDEAIEHFTKAYLKVVPLKIDHSIRMEFRLNVDTPSEVGADRLANAAYAAARLSLPAIVVDIGTATTFDLIGKEKTYEGGVILPGVQLAAKALGVGTAKLPIIDLAFPQSVIGKNTVSCIQSGLLYGYCDLMDGLIQRTENEIGESCSIALTGGLSHLFEHRLTSKFSLLPNLTLEGIEILYHANR